MISLSFHSGREYKVRCCMNFQKRRKFKGVCIAQSSFLLAVLYMRCTRIYAADKIEERLNHRYDHHQKKFFFFFCVCRFSIFPTNCVYIQRVVDVFVYYIKVYECYRLFSFVVILCVQNGIGRYLYIYRNKCY